jgi:uncharacterized protein
MKTLLAITTFALMAAGGYTETFFQIVKHGTAQQVQAAIKAGADVNLAEDSEANMLPIEIAAQSNPDPGVVTALARAGADVNEKETNGIVPLMFAANGNRNPAVIAALLKAGANVNAATTGQVTVLMMASANNAAVVVAALLKGGARVNDVDVMGNAALMWAASGISTDPQVITVLLKAGANGRLKNSDGMTAFDLAKKNVLLDKAPQLQDLEASAH